MADSPSSSSSKKKSSSSPSSSTDSTGKGGFLSRKIFGIPLWVIVLAIVGIYYWYTHYGPGAKNKQQASQQKRPFQPVGRGRGGTRVIVVDRGGGRGHKRHKRNPRANQAPAAPLGGNVGGGMTARAAAMSPDQLATMPTGGPVDASSGAPVYAQYQAYYGAVPGGDGASADDSVPEPVPAYAPMTGGGIYG